MHHLRLQSTFSPAVETALEQAAAECPSLEPLRLQDEYDAREPDWGRIRNVTVPPRLGLPPLGDGDGNNAPAID